jgi:type IV fimbrial biogenesis protein FimT
MRRPCHHGFTLIELMVTIAILAILIILGFPNYEQWIRNTRIRNAAESIQNGLREARNEASQRGSNVRFQLTGSGTDTANWTVCQLPPASTVATDCSTGAVIDSFNAQGGADTVQVTVSTSPSDILNNAAFQNLITGVPTATTGITFNSLGRPSSYNGTSIVRIDTTAAAANSRRLVTFISSGGMVRMCDPTYPFSATFPQGCK